MIIFQNKFGSLLQYSKDISAANNNANVAEFNGANATNSFNFKAKKKKEKEKNG